MSRRLQIMILVVLLVVLAGVTLRNSGRAPQIAVVFSADEPFKPLEVENPALRLDLLEHLRKLEYSGIHRNIFSPELPPPPAPAPPKTPEPQPPPPPPLLQVPLKFFGYAADPQTGKRRAFFTNGEDVFIVSEGETFYNQYRLLRIGNASADVEEISSGRRASLPLEQPPG